MCCKLGSKCREFHTWPKLKGPLLVILLGDYQYCVNWHCGNYNCLASVLRYVHLYLCSKILFEENMSCITISRWCQGCGAMIRTYHGVFPLYSLPPMLAKFTTRPLAILTSGRNVLVISISPHRFTSAVRLNILIGAQSIGSMYPIPALFTSPHSPPAQEEILNDRRVIRRAVFFIFFVNQNNSRLVKWSRS